ncbi:MAG: glycerophosphodiester phosphodiesterase [Deltaproteobacteria bacterium]|nr:glycerophosphodiester phosphodiesterase [Deltaproteobacteria bacterium]
MLARLLTRPYPSRHDRPLVLGHRGASADAPENTLAAFREAVRQGADGVELDVMRCGSGELVVCHDEWLDRLAGEHLEVARTPLVALRRLDVGSRHSARFTGERIPTLAEALAVLPRAAVCNVEIKCDTLLDRGLSFRVAREIRRSEAGQDLVLSSFNPLSLARARFFAPRLPAALLVDTSQNLPLREAAARALGAAAVHVEHRLCTPDSVRRWHRQGFKVAAWTVDEPGDVERCCAAGVDVLISNRPRAVLVSIDRLGIAD